jgi:nucleoside-diphosphate-sugar epimerase
MNLPNATEVPCEPQLDSFRVNHHIPLLITGATGFLGVPCVNRAVASGYAVHATARSRREPVSVPFHSVDLFDANRVTELLAIVRPTHLLHLAWIATPGVYWTSPENRAWIEASKHLLSAFAQSGGKRVLIAGTCAEYDWITARVCREFETPTRPMTEYGKCKNELREWAIDFGQREGVSIAWARMFFMYGPQEHPARLVPAVASALLAGKPAECSLGTQERDFLHTFDLADALVSLLGSNITGPLNVGAGKAIAVRQVVEIVARMCGRPDLVRLGARPTPAHEPPLLVPDVTRLRDELGWRPRIDLEDGLRETVDWWRARHAA